MVAGPDRTPRQSIRSQTREIDLLMHKISEAAAEFQQFVDRGDWALSGPLVPLAKLGLGRAYAMQGDTANARAGESKTRGAAEAGPYTVRAQPAHGPYAARRLAASVPGCPALAPWWRFKLRLSSFSSWGLSHPDCAPRKGR